MAGRDKKLPAMPGTSRKSSLQSPGRSSDPPSRRQSLLLPSPPPRFSSPYSMRSESPMRTLRNGKQQKMINSNMLDGIPLTRKRTRSVISDCDTQSLFNASFNDTASLAGDFNPPDSPTSLFSLFTPRRRSRNQNSESCSVMSMPVTTPRQKRLDILAQIAMPSPSRKSLINRKANLAEKTKKTVKADSAEKKQRPLIGKRKLNKSNEVAEGPVKKVRKNAKQTPKTESPGSLKGSKTTTPVVRRRKKVINEKEDGKVKTRVINKAGKNNIVVKKRNKMLVSNSLLSNGLQGRKPKLTPQVLAARKISRTTRGKVMRGAAAKKVVQKVKRKRAVKPAPPTELLTSVQRRKLQSIALDGVDMDEIAKRRRAEKAARKAALLETPGTEQKKNEKVEDNEGDKMKKEAEPETGVQEAKTSSPEATESTSKKLDDIIIDTSEIKAAGKIDTVAGPTKIIKRVWKKKVIAKPTMEVKKVSGEEIVTATAVQSVLPVSVMSTTITSAAATAAATAVILATSSSSISATVTAAPKPLAKKVSKPDEDMKLESSDSSTDGETLNTLNQVSKILKEIVDTPPESAIENNVEDFTARSENRTPRSEIRTPKNLEFVNKTNEDAGRENKTPPDPDSEYKPPKDIDSDTKTPPPSSPKISNTLQPTEMNGVDPQKDQVSPINSLASKLRRKLSQSPGVTVPGKVVLPIINSLSAAAKQTSSFLNCTDNTSPTGPVTRRETQWKVNKKLIYNKIKTPKQYSGQKLNSLALKGKVTNLLNKKSQISPRQGQLLGGLTSPDGSIFGEQINSENMNGSDMDTSSEVVDETNLLTENAEVEDKCEKPTEETVGLDSNENKVESKTDQPTTPQPVATTATDVVIPDKDTNDEHSSVTETATTAPSITTTVTVIENNLDTEKTDKEAPIEKPIEKEPTETIVEQRSQSVPPREMREFEDDEEMPPLRLDDSFVTSSPFTTPSKLVIDETPTSPETNKEPEPPKNTTIMFEEEDLVAKASVLGALGLQSNKVLSEQAKAPKVPKLRLVCRPSHKKHRRSTNSDPSAPNYKEKTYTVCREGDSIGDWDPSPVKIVKDPALDPCSRSLLWYPRMPISNGKALETLVEVPVPEQPGVGVGDGQNGDNIDGGEKSSEPLVIPEKSSSFAIHPGRLCEDVCCYCHNKFGLYDTPLHVAQLKGEDKQKAVLAREPLLTLESCLCDACFRHLDRPGPPRGPKPPVSKQARAQPNEVCCFDGCIHVAVHPLMRKWKRRVRTMLRRDLQEGKAWTCDQHYAQLARVSACGMCLRRSASQQMYKLEEKAAPRLNELLQSDSIPVTLNGESYLCKKCRYYASLRLRSEDTTQLNPGNRLFLKDHRSRVLKVFNIDPTTVEELFNELEKPKKQGKKKNNGASPIETPEVTPVPSPAAAKAPSPQPATPSTPITPVAPVTTSTKPSKQIRIKLANPTPKNSPATHKNGTPTQKNATPTQKSSTPSPSPRLNAAKPGVTNPRASATAVRPSPTQAKDKNDLRRVATQNASTSTGKSTSTPVSRLSVNYASTSRTKPVSILPRPTPQSSMVNNDVTDPYSFVVSPPPPPTPPHEFPSASDVGMNSTFDFQPLEPNSMWQKVNATFQFDKKTRTLWHQLHAPYGSYTSFLRHLVLLETHWRNGDLSLTPNASPRARQYLGSVRNRIEAYEGVPAVQETTSNVPLILDVRSLAPENAGGWNV